MFHRPEALRHVDWTAAANLLREARTLVLTTHVRPDCDGIGTEVALQRYLSSIGKQAQVINSDPIPDRLRFLDPAGVVRAYQPSDAATLDAADLLIVVDVSELHRLGALSARARRARQLLVIDHHVGDWSDNHAVRVVEPRAASTGMLAYDLLVKLGAKFDRVMAEAIYATIVADTGSFRFGNTTSEVLRVAADLIELGANPQRVYQGVLACYTQAKTRLLARALDMMSLAHSGKLSWLYISHELLSDVGASEHDADGIIEYLRLLDGVMLSLLFVQLGEKTLKVSYRSEGDLDVNRLASLWGGGGHVHAAGATIEGQPDDIIRDVLSEASKLVVEA